MKENNDLSSQLRAEDNRVLTDMVVYIRGADISEYQQELVRRDITQMLIDGEQRGDTLEEIIGGDYKDFCDSVLNEVPHLTRAEKAVSFLGVVSVALAVLLGIQLLFSLMDLAGENGTWQYHEPCPYFVFCPSALQCHYQKFLQYRILKGQKAFVSSCTCLIRMYMHQCIFQYSCSVSSCIRHTGYDPGTVYDI